MARKLIVELVGDDASLLKSFRRSSQAANRFDRSVSQAVRGAAAGSGVFRTFGRSVAFASGGFIAFHEASQFLTDSINAAREAAVAQRSLAAQMKASGESFNANRQQIDRVALSYGRFGFQNDKVIESLTVLERGTGKISDAIRLQGLAADLARAKNLDLAAAANVVAKVFGGQETALRRAVPGLQQNAHGWDLIRLAQQKLAGQAAANTTASERFAATLHDTEEIIGTALLPTLNKYLTQLGKWLQKMNESGQLQKDVAATTRTVGAAFTFTAGAIGAATTAYNKYRAATSHLPGGGGFLSKLLGGTLVDQFKDFYKRGQRLGIFPSGGKQTRPGFYGTNLFGVPRIDMSNPDLTFFGGGSTIPGRVSGGIRILTPAQQHAIALAGSPNLATLRAARSYDWQQLKKLEDRYVAGRISAKAYADQVVSLKNEIASLTGQINQTLTDQAKRSRLGLPGRVSGTARIHAAVPSTVHGAVAGLLPFMLPQRVSGEYQFLQAGYQAPAGLQLAQARAEAIGQNMRPILVKLRDAARKALRSGKLSIEAQIDAWNAIADVNSRLAGMNKGFATRYRPPAQGFALAGGGSVVIHGDVNLHGVADPQAFEQALQKRAAARPQVRRGAR